MPVDDEINLNDPEGLTQEDLDIMNREADELEQLAEGAERNAEKIKKATDSLKGMDFATKNIIQSEVEGKPTDMGAVDISTRLNLLEKQLMEVAVEAQSQKKTDQEHTKKLTNHQTLIQKLEDEVEKGIGELDSNISKFESATSNPLAFGKSKIIGMVGKAGVYGAIALFVYKMVEKYWEAFQDTFKAGGANDIRKLMEDRDKEMMELNDIVDRRAGRVFFTESTTLRQGSPNFSNTMNLADQVVRFQALHLGE